MKIMKPDPDPGSDPEAIGEYTVEGILPLLQQNDSDAILTFMRKFRPVLRKFLQQKGLATDVAEELANDCVSKAIQKIDQFTYKGAKSLNRWLYTIARNLLNDWLRVQQKQNIVDNDISLDYQDEDLSPNMEAISALWDAIDSLKPADQQIIISYNFEYTRTFAEIGKILGITEATARRRHGRAIVRLQVLLEDDPRIEKYLNDNSRYLNDIYNEWMEKNDGTNKQ